MITCHWTDVRSISLAQVVCEIELVHVQSHGRGQVRGGRRHGRRGALGGGAAGRPGGRWDEVSGGPAGKWKSRTKIGDLSYY